MAVHCKTQEQWDKVAEINNIKWRDVTWSEYGRFSCVRVTLGSYSSFDYYISTGESIISFEEYIATLKKDVEYKVGDKVKIREDLEVNTTYGCGINFASGMLKYVGKEVKLTEEKKGYGFCIDIDGDEDWTWSTDMFECKLEEIKEQEPQKETTLSLSELGCDLEELGEILKEVADLETALEDKLGQAEKLISKYGLDISMDDYRRNSK